MTRDEAAAVLADIPEIARIECANLKPGDVIVVEADHPLSQDTCRRIEGLLRSIWPNQRTVVLTDGLKLKVVRKSYP